MNTTNMKAVGLTRYLPIEDEASLIDINIERPKVAGHDLLVVVKAVSVNPVDTKVRAPKEQVELKPRTLPHILGWDAVGEVIAIGEGVKCYEVGDRVYYAGDITRPGSNSEYQLVDERIVGRAPKKLNDAEAAAMPLTTITAWEALFDRLCISRTGEDEGKSILIIGGAGGVGSIATQLAHKVAKLKVIATASRDETIDWVKKMGAELTINHRMPIDEELKKIDMPQVDFILCLNSTAQHWVAMANAIAPQGRICTIVESPEPMDLGLLKSKSATFVWEFMFTRSMYQTPDMIEQQRLLNEVSVLIDQGEIVSTMNQVITPINAENLRKAHAIIEKGNAIGKLVLSGWN